MAVEGDGPAAGPAPDRGQTLGQVVVELRPVVDVTAPAAGSPVAALVVGGRVDAGARQLVADALVPSRVLSQAVHEKHRGPRGSGPCAPGLGLVDRPVSDEQVGAVGGRDVPDEGGHAGRVRDRSGRVPCVGPGGCQAGSPTAGCAIGPSCAWVACALAPARAGMNRAAIAPNPTTTAPTAMAGCNPATYAAGVV